MNQNCILPMLTFSLTSLYNPFNHFHYVLTASSPYNYLVPNSIDLPVSRNHTQFTIEFASSATRSIPTSLEAFNISTTIPDVPAALSLFILLIAFFTHSLFILTAGPSIGSEDDKPSLSCSIPHLQSTVVIFSSVLLCTVIRI